MLSRYLRYTRYARFLSRLFRQLNPLTLLLAFRQPREAVGAPLFAAHAVVYKEQPVGGRISPLPLGVSDSSNPSTTAVTSCHR
jgi:hypothetical protein